MEIIAFSLGTMGFILATTALVKITRLEEQLKKTGVLEKEYTSE